MNLEVKKAELSDYPALFDFYNKVYPKNHPLKNVDFWAWQYGDEARGAAYVVCDENRIYGHVGAYFNQGLAWIINVYLEEEARGRGFLGKMYSLARNTYGELAATSANNAGLGLYRNMRWFRYSDLERVIFSKDQSKTPLEIISSVNLVNNTVPDDNHYWSQPGIKGHILSDGSTGVIQEDVGGFRFVNIINIEEAKREIWELGFKWADYVSSWNDLKLGKLIKAGAQQQDKLNFPWYLNPVDTTKPFRVSFLSENPLSKDFVCMRISSDHGRVGVLPNKQS